MGERVLGVLKAGRWVLSIPPYVREFLLFTPDKVIVARQSTRLPYSVAGVDTGIDDVLSELPRAMSVEDDLMSDKHSFAISNSEVKKVELKKSWEGWRHAWHIDLKIVTSEREYKWNDVDIPKKKDAEFEDLKNILRPIFGDRLSARLAVGVGVGR